MYAYIHIYYHGRQIILAGSLIILLITFIMTLLDAEILRNMVNTYSLYQSITFSGKKMYQSEKDGAQYYQSEKGGLREDGSRDKRRKLKGVGMKDDGSMLGLRFLSWVYMFTGSAGVRGDNRNKLPCFNNNNIFICIDVQV